MRTECKQDSFGFARVEGRAARQADWMRGECLYPPDANGICRDGVRTRVPGFQQ
jgi:hypothetical protein